jgi:hypothetical protein
VDERILERGAGFRESGATLRTLVGVVCLGYKQHLSLFLRLPTTITDISKRLSQTDAEPSVQLSLVTAS